MQIKKLTKLLRKKHFIKNGNILNYEIVLKILNLFPKMFRNFPKYLTRSKLFCKWFRSTFLIVLKNLGTCFEIYWKCGIIFNSAVVRN